MSKLSMKLKYLFITLLLFIGGCGESNDTDEPLIAVSIPPLADLAYQIAGNRINVKTLLPPGANMHSFEPSPETLKNLYQSELFFSLGKYSIFEHNLINKIGRENIKKIIDFSNSIKIIENDPHYWLSPENAKVITDLMLKEFIELLPQHKPYFINNKKRFVEKLDSIDNRISNILNSKKDKIIFVYHPAWRYFAEHYGIEQFSIEQEGKTPKAGNLKNIIASAKRNGVKCIFFDPHFDNNSVLAVAEELNLSIDSLDPLPEKYLFNLLDISNKLDKHLR